MNGEVIATTTARSRLPSAIGAGATLLFVGQLHAAQVSESAEQKPTSQLSTVVVQGARLDENQRAETALKEVAGGVNYVDSATVEKGRVSTSTDIFALQPGVIATQGGGSNDGTRISIRGSGINKGVGYFRAGIFYLFDGLPVSGPGGTPYELFEPLGLSHTEVLRGGNAFDIGSLYLGGAINYVTKTGYDSAPLQVRYEAGSYGYQKRQISSGQVLGPLDYYVSLTDSASDGFQDQTQGKSAGFVGNFGYQFSPQLKSRLYYRYRTTDNETPGYITRAQLKDDPEQANPASVNVRAHRKQPGSTWVASKTQYTFDDDSNLEVGLVYHDYPIDARQGVNRTAWGFSDYSASLKYDRLDTLFGKNSITRFNVLRTEHLNAYAKTKVRIPSGITANLPSGALVRKAEYEGSDTVLSASNETEWIDNTLWLSAGLSAVEFQRKAKVSYPAGGEADNPNNPIEKNDWGFAPRVGVRYQINPNWQLFGNLSRTVEAQQSWAYVSGAQVFTSGPATGLNSGGQKLEPQIADTLEFGTRGQLGNNTWDLTFYRSHVQDELLSVIIREATSSADALTSEYNASKTIHQGVELGLDSLLYQNDGDGLHLRQSYTYSDFFYRDDEQFGSNRLPGIPKHNYQAELRYDFSNGVYVGVNTYYASKTPMDFANTKDAGSYNLWGAILGWDSPKKDWNVYLDLRNLTDEKYAASISPAFNAGGNDVRAIIPGDGFGAYAGVQYSFR
ncbi:TonB-dependent receptor [Pseudomonas sp. CFBP 8770]|uniref:TonB-dependent receptor family protein n=1 Tax=unclassified Pseudomonas TaxID=196821 RepID=UPI00177DA38E|nr:MULTISPECIES: TonB-dependent receptor [unclassified Pseudomonas]MBD8474766.1 TonB-dependent receptor [Pseudomonas sp. CFBP 8773]MBD8647895.1 TonB-dependent receptor [Pseudomonas sp. CFBP 8770]